MITHNQKEVEVPTWKFPCHGIGIANGTIVLFLAKGIGTVVYSPSSSDYLVGTFDTDWIMSYFTPCAKGTSTTFTDE
jgi:hypothetical protein